MASHKKAASSFGNKVISYLDAHKDAHDVTFLVGSTKEEIPGLKFALQAACPALDALFRNNWNKSWEKGLLRLRVSLPDVDPEAFRIFLKVLIWDKLKLEAIQELNLSLETVLHLINISKQLQMAEMYEIFCAQKTNIQGHDDDLAVTISYKSFKLKIRNKNHEQKAKTSTYEDVDSGQGSSINTGIRTKGNVSVGGDVNNVIETSTDVPKFVPPVTIFYAIDPPSPSFTGRTDVLQAIHKRVQACSLSINYIDRIVVLCGLDGIGKTEIALKYAKEFITEDFIKNVAWIDAETLSSMKKSFNSLALLLNVSTNQLDDLDATVTGVYKHFSDHVGTGLFIFDNAPQFNDSEFQILNYLPTSESLERRPLILITSIEQNWEITLENKITIKELTIDESVALFTSKLKLSNNQLSPNDRNAVSKLAKSFQGFPLGLSIAAANIDPDLDLEFEIKQYLKRMEMPEDGWGEDTQSGAVTRYKLVMKNVWEMTLKKIAALRDGSDALNLLNLMAFCPAEHMTVESISDIFQFIFGKPITFIPFSILKKKSMVGIETISALTAASVEEQEQQARRLIKIHKLVQKTTRDNLKLVEVYENLTSICNCVIHMLLSSDSKYITSALMCAHNHLKLRKWPYDSICYSVIFCSLILFFENQNQDILLSLVQDVYNHLNMESRSLVDLRKEDNAINLFCLCLIWIHKHNTIYAGYEFLLSHAMLRKENFENAVLLFGSYKIESEDFITDKLGLNGLQRYLYKKCYGDLYELMTAEKISWGSKINGFPPRRNHAAVAVGNVIYSFGGVGDYGEPSYTRDFLDVFVLNVNDREKEWKLIAKPFLPRFSSTPNQRKGHSAVAHKEFVLIFGGWDTKKGKSNSTYRFNTLTRKWDKPKVTGNVPYARWYHSAVVVRNEMYIYGGGEVGFEFTNDLHSLNLESFCWSTIEAKGIPPSIREGHSATVHDDRFILIFGGYDWKEQTRVNTIASFDLQSKTWTAVKTRGTPPSGRRDHCAFVHNGRMYIFGGSNFSSYFNDVFSYDAETFEWREEFPNGEAPSPRELAACVAMDDHVFIFGGYTFNPGYLRDTHVLEM